MPYAHRWNGIYLPVAPTPAMFLILRLNFLGSNDQKHSVGKRIQMLLLIKSKVTTKI